MQPILAEVAPDATASLITEMTGKFTEVITQLPGAVQGILIAGIAIAVAFVVYKIAKKAFNKSTS